MVEFLENLGEIISEKAKVVGKKTEEVVDLVARKTEQTVEIQKIKNQIRTMKRNNERDYQDMGKMIYEKYKNGEEVDSIYMELCQAIKERDVEIEKAKATVEELKEI